VAEQEAKSVIELLEEWRFSARKMQYCHFAAANHFRKRHYWIGVPAVISSIVVGTSVFATLAREIDASIKILVGLMSVFATVLTGLQTFLRYEGRAEKHYSAGVQFGEVRRELEQYEALRKPGASQTEADKDFLDGVRKRITELPRTAPEIPQGLWDKRDVLAREAKEPKLGQS
jgi:hypothetical protein